MVQIRFVQAAEDVLRRRRRGQGLDRSGDPTVRIPRSCNASRKAASCSARSPASQWRAGVERVPTRAIACSTVSTKGSTERASRGVPTGRGRAKIKPAAGSAIRPGWRPNWAGQWRFPLPRGAMVASSALAGLPWDKTVPCVESSLLVCDPVMGLEHRP